MMPPLTQLWGAIYSGVDPCTSAASGSSRAERDGAADCARRAV